MAETADTAKMDSAQAVSMEAEMSAAIAEKAAEVIGAIVRMAQESMTEELTENMAAEAMTAIVLTKTGGILPTDIRTMDAEAVQLTEEGSAAPECDVLRISPFDSNSVNAVS